MTLNLTLRHPARIQRDDLLVKTIKAGLVLLDQLWLELTAAVTRHVNLDLSALAAHGLWSRAVAGVAGVVAGSVVLLVAEVVCQLSVESTLNQRLRELLEKPVLSKQVFRLLIVFQ
jgi:hypothetical protein